MTTYAAAGRDQRPLTPESDHSPLESLSGKPPLARYGVQVIQPLQPLSFEKDATTTDNRRFSTSSTSAAAGAGQEPLRRRSTSGSWSQAAGAAMNARRGSAASSASAAGPRVSRTGSYSYDQQRRGTTMGTEQHEEESGSGAGLLVSIPLVIAIVPPLLSAVTGNSHIWGDVLLFLFIAYYLQYLMRVPWDLYEASRSSRIEAAANAPSPTAGSDASPTATAAQQAAVAASAAELRRLELLNLFFVIASPFLGGVGLWLSKRYLFSPNGPISSQFNIGLFVFASGIRPAVHVAELLKNRALHLQKEIHMPYPEIELLKRRVNALESELASVRMIAESRVGDVEGVQDALQGVEKLKNAVKKLREGKEQGLYLRDHELLMELERKVLEQDQILEALRSGELIVLSEQRNGEDGEASSGIVGAAVNLTGKVVKRSMELMFLPATIGLSFARAFISKAPRTRKSMIEG